MKAITTKYLRATATKYARIKASADGWGAVTIAYPHKLSGEAAHAEAAASLCRRIGWNGTMVAGDLDGTTTVFVLIGRDPAWQTFTVGVAP
jgi:hypothetical protein